MAKLSRKQARRLSFMLYKLVLTHDQQQREDLLTALLDALNIDQEQREESAEDAARILRLDASRKIKRPSPPVDASGEPDIYAMSLEELQAHNRQLFAKLERLLEDRKKQDNRKRIEDMSDEERRRYIAELLAKRDEVLQQPAPTVEEAPTYTINEKQRRRLAAFDDLPEADQVDQLRAMWGAS